MAIYLASDPPSFDGKNMDGYIKQLSVYTPLIHEELDFEIGRLRKAETGTGEKLSLFSDFLEGLSSRLDSLEKRIAALEK